MSSRRCFCLVPSSWSLEDYRNAGPCGQPGGHSHLTLRDVYGPIDKSAFAYEVGSSRIARDFTGTGGQLDLGLVEWLAYPRVLRIAYQPAMLRHKQVRGLSCRLGAYLAQAWRRREPWAEMMREDMRHQICHPRAIDCLTART